MAPIASTKQSMRVISHALIAYQSSSGFLPPDLQSLTEGKTPYIDKVPLDAWKHPLVYLPSGQPNLPYVLRSVGPDGRFGTSDDIDVFTMDQ